MWVEGVRSTVAGIYSLSTRRLETFSLGEIAVWSAISHPTQQASNLRKLSNLEFINAPACSAFDPRSRKHHDVRCSSAAVKDGLVVFDLAILLLLGPRAGKTEPYHSIPTSIGSNPYTLPFSTQNLRVPSPLLNGRTLSNSTAPAARSPSPSSERLA